MLERIDSIRVYIYLCSIIGIAYPFASFYNGITLGYHYYGITLRVFPEEGVQRSCDVDLRFDFFADVFIVKEILGRAHDGLGFFNTSFYFGVFVEKGSDY